MNDSIKREIKEKMDETLKVNKKKESIYVSKYDINGRKRSLLERFFLKIIKILKKIKEMIENEEEIKQYELKIQKLIDSMQKAEDLGIESREELLEKLNEVGKELSVQKSENAAIASLLDSYNEIYEEVSQYESLKDKVIKLGLNPSDLIVEESTKEDIRRNNAKLNPMTSNQKKVLFTILEKEDYYKLDCKFDEVNRKEGQELIEFLNDKTKEKPELLITIDEFEFKRLQRQYDKAKEKRLEAMKNKLNTPLTKDEQQNLLKMVGTKEIDVLNATKYDYIRVMNYVNRKNPLLTPAKSNEPLDIKLKDQLRDLLKIYPSEDIGEISKNLDSLDNERGKKLYNYLLEMDLVPEILQEDKEEIYERLIEPLTPEEQDICNQFRYVGEKINKYGIKDLLKFKEEILVKKEELEKSLETYKETAALYGELQYIKRNEEYCHSETFIYGGFDKNNIEVKEVEKPSKDEEELIKPRKKQNISI